MNCPYKDCLYEPPAGESFKVIKKTTFKDHVERGHVCPKCNRSFVSYQKAAAIPYYKKELYNRSKSNG